MSTTASAPLSRTWLVTGVGLMVLGPIAQLGALVLPDALAYASVFLAVVCSPAALAIVLTLGLTQRRRIYQGAALLGAGLMVLEIVGAFAASELGCDVESVADLLVPVGWLGIAIALQLASGAREAQAWVPVVVLGLVTIVAVAPETAAARGRVVLMADVAQGLVLAWCIAMALRPLVVSGPAARARAPADPHARRAPRPEVMVLGIAGLAICGLGLYLGTKPYGGVPRELAGSVVALGMLLATGAPCLALAAHRRGPARAWAWLGLTIAALGILIGALSLFAALTQRGRWNYASVALLVSSVPSALLAAARLELAPPEHPSLRAPLTTALLAEGLGALGVAVSAALMLERGSGPEHVLMLVACIGVLGWARVTQHQAAKRLADHELARAFEDDDDA